METIDQKEPGRGWIGPHIYDGDGELIWSGASLPEVQNWDVVDFRMSKVMGEDRMTFLAPFSGYGYALDNEYTMRDSFEIGTWGVDLDAHEFHFIENGQRLLILDESRYDVTRIEDTGLAPGEHCRGLFPGFWEVDTETGQPVYEWTSMSHVSLLESSWTAPLWRDCSEEWGWDYLQVPHRLRFRTLLMTLQPRQLR
jgi:hypothetical protein